MKSDECTQNTILQHLITESAPSDQQQQSQYKFAVTSTIFQHSPPAPAAAPVTGSETKAGGAEAAAYEGNVGVTGKRGMHSATGAYWNNEKDGMWSHKYDEEKKGFDVVVSVIWISLL